MSPSVYIIAGPNGAGKTTFARKFLPRYAECRIFVNADLIAQGLSPFAPEGVAFQAGRLMLAEIERFAEQRVDFSFETTLSGTTYLKLIRGLRARGYQVHIFFVWVPEADLALKRIQDRVIEGGHSVPEPVVRRRYERSMKNFFGAYRGQADSWMLFDNSGAALEIIAFKKPGELRIINQKLYEDLMRRYREL